MQTILLKLALMPAWQQWVLFGCAFMLAIFLAVMVAVRWLDEHEAAVAQQWRDDHGWDPNPAPAPTIVLQTDSPERRVAAARN